MESASGSSSPLRPTVNNKFEQTIRFTLSDRCSQSKELIEQVAQAVELGLKFAEEVKKHKKIKIQDSDNPELNKDGEA